MPIKGKYGKRKWGGREKGTPNKDTAELQEICKRLKCSPFEVTILFAKGDWKALGYEAEKYVSSESEKATTYKYTIDPSVRAKCASDACQYLYAKRKAVEVSGPEGGAIETNNELANELLSEFSAALKGAGERKWSSSTATH